MKKLLSLLSVLTISGTAVPTTIAASPYQKEETLNSEINLQINNLEKLSRKKRNGTYVDKKIEINIIQPEQNNETFIQTSIIETILRHILGDSFPNYQQENGVSAQQYYYQDSNTFNRRNPLPCFQSFNYLLNDNISLLTNLNSQYNDFFRTNPNYEVDTLFSNITNIERDYEIFYELISYTINQNMPAILRSIDSTYLIVGYFGNIEQPRTLRYHFINLENQLDVYFGGESLMGIFRNTETSLLTLSNFFAFGGDVINNDICRELEYNVFKNSNYNNRRSDLKKRDTNSNNCKLYLPYFKKDDYFKVWGKSGHDGIELKISLETAIAFEDFFHKNRISEIKNYLENLIKHVEQKNERWSGEILDTDRELMKNFIYDGYLKFHDKFLQLIYEENRNKKNNSIFVRTWRTYNWADLSEEYQNSAFYISKNSRGNNY